MPRTSKAITEIDARCVDCEVAIRKIEAELDAAKRQHKMLLELKLALTVKPKAPTAKRASAPLPGS